MKNYELDEIEKRKGVGMVDKRNYERKEIAGPKCMIGQPLVGMVFVSRSGVKH